MKKPAEKIKWEEPGAKNFKEFMFDTSNTEQDFSLVDDTCFESDRKGKAREAVAQALRDVEHESRKEAAKIKSEDDKKTKNFTDRIAIYLIKDKDEMEDSNEGQREIMKNYTSKRTRHAI